MSVFLLLVHDKVKVQLMCDMILHVHVICFCSPLNRHPLLQDIHKISLGNSTDRQWGWTFS